MIYSEEQKEKIKSNFEQIAKYIEDEILPYIDYDYETPPFGVIEHWGRFDENQGKRLTIRLNHYSDKIAFCYAGVPHAPMEFATYNDEHAVQFLQYWKDAKLSLQQEINNNNYKVKIINEFKI